MHVITGASIMVCVNIMIQRLFMVQGFAELEYGMLRYMGAIDDSTPIVTSGKSMLFFSDILGQMLLRLLLSYHLSCLWRHHLNRS